MTIDAAVGGEDANSFVTVAETDAYHLARLNAKWAALGNAAKEAALIKSTDYLEATYGASWKGERASDTQALGWPRMYVFVDGYEMAYDEIPVAVQRAQMELALKASSSVLLEDEGQSVKREKVDILEVEYQSGSASGTRYSLVSRLLAPYTTGTTGSSNFSQVSLSRV